jgi:hypothetical protein
MGVQISSDYIGQMRGRRRTGADLPALHQRQAENRRNGANDQQFEGNSLLCWSDAAGTSETPTTINIITVPSDACIRPPLVIEHTADDPGLVKLERANEPELDTRVRLHPEPALEPEAAPIETEIETESALITQEDPRGMRIIRSPSLRHR